MSRKWTEEEINILEDCYSKYMSLDEIAKLIPARNKTAIESKACKLRLGDKYVKKYSSKFTAIYQDYDWCYQHYIVENMTFEEMAELAHCTLRVIQKWCSEKHKLNSNTRINMKQLSDEQRQIIVMGTLGDGHIDKRPEAHMYIEAHAENEKEYMFWKYAKLQNLCNKEPRYIQPTIKYINDKPYQCQATYYMRTHILNCLHEIYLMSKIDKIKEMTETGLALYLLDDGSRGYSNWQICVASLNEEERNFFIDKCASMGYNGHVKKDVRYVNFDAESSRRLDKIILDTVGDIDITRKKILNNNIAKGRA